MPFRTRAQAAQLLAARLAEYRGRFPLVLLIPRSAVPMGQIIAEALEGELDVVLVHRLLAPGRAKVAIAAVDETGYTYLGQELCRLGISATYLAEETRAALAVLRGRRALYTPGRPPIDPAGRIVIIVGHSILNGGSMMAALHAVRARHPAKLIAAAAVGSPKALLRIAADEAICLEVPDCFYAVEEFFRDFSQVSDAEVAAILQRSRHRTVPAA